MTMRLLCSVLLAGTAIAASSKSSSSANPIRRVVALLQTMQKRVTDEGKRDAETYAKFDCYCKTGAGDLETSISAAQTKMPRVTSQLDAAKAKQIQLVADLKSHTGSRSDAKEAVAQATSLRKKEATTFAKEQSDTLTNIKALGGAIASISKGSFGAGFLQTTTASVVRHLTISMDMGSADRDRLSAFLSEGQSGVGSNEYAPAGGEVLGILKEMEDTMNAELTSIEKAEKEAIEAFQGLSAAKAKEIAANTKAIEEKTTHLGRVGVEIENLREDLEDTGIAYEQDQKFLADLNKNCVNRLKEWEAVQRTRADELVALADTIRIINDDDALSLFKQTLPSPSLLQAQVGTIKVRGQAINALRASSVVADPRLDLISLALHGKKVSFEKVLAMCDDMISILKVEQVDDDDKKVFCEGRLDAKEDEKKELDLDIADLKKTVEETEGNLLSLKEEIAALTTSIKALDKSVADATAARKEESAEFQSTMAADAAAKRLLGIAKNRLYQFYDPRMYKAPANMELSAQQRIAVNMGSEIAPTEAPSGIAGTGVVASLVEVNQHVHRSSGQEAPPPAPEAVGPYQKRGQESSGVLAMMDLLVADLDKEMSEMKVEETDSQAEYENFMSNSAGKRRTDSKSLEEKEARKAYAEGLLQQTISQKKSTEKEAYETAVVIKDLHLECDWLVTNFEARKQARAGELDSLANAKAVLSGADYALL